MLRRLSMWIGGLIQRLIDYFATPVEVSEEEMKKSERDLMDRIEADRKNKEQAGEQ